MNPRKELEELILDADSFDRAAKRTRGFAIGRWVSVEERLPVVDSSGKWAGYTKDLEGVIAFGYYDYHNLCVFYSAWLELDMPKQPNEKGEG